MKNKSLLILSIIVVIGVIMIPIGISYGMSHNDYSDPDWACKKWIGIAELAKQDYPGFLEDSLTMAEMKCGFDVNQFLK